MFIEILSVCKKKETDTISPREEALGKALDEHGYTLQGVKKSILKSAAVKMTLNSIANSDKKPDVVIVTGGLRSKDSSSFKKYFVETVVAAEKAVNEPAPKDYWKKRNKAFKEARERKADADEIKKLEEEYELTRKKAKVFSLGDFGNGYKGYAFVYKGLRVAAVPKEELTGKDFSEIAVLAAERTTEVFENSKNEFPDGFSDVKYVPAKTGFVNRFIPLPGDGKKEIARKCVVILSAIVFAAALWFLLQNTLFATIHHEQEKQKLVNAAHGGTAKLSGGGGGGASYDDKSGSEIDWDKLKDINKEIVGWIQISDTKIDYPVLWHKGDDINDQYYLNHDVHGDYDSYGCVFLDYRCTEGMSSKNIVLHGHHMNDGSMFAGLMDYGGTEGDLDFYKKHPTIVFDREPVTDAAGNTVYRDGVYKIISVFKTNTLSSHGEFFNYMVGNFHNNDKEFLNYVYNVRVRSLINCPVDADENDELLTLSTCSYEYTNFRTVVVARKTRYNEDVKVDTSKASLNDNAVWPEVYYNSRGGTRPTLTDFCTAYEKKQIDWYSGDPKKFTTIKKQKVTEPTTAAATTEKGTEKSESPSSTARTTEPVKLYDVTFINYDGSFIENQVVEEGKSAKAPPDPVKPSDKYYDYVFKGWGLDFKKVTSNMKIAPIFEPVLKPEYTKPQ